MVRVNTLATPVEVLKAWAEPHLDKVIDKVIDRATEDTGDSIENLQPELIQINQYFQISNPDYFFTLPCHHVISWCA